jgi:hypothetical protein
VFTINVCNLSGSSLDLAIFCDKEKQRTVTGSKTGASSVIQMRETAEGGGDKAGECCLYEGNNRQSTFCGIHRLEMEEVVLKSLLDLGFLPIAWVRGDVPSVPHHPDWRFSVRFYKSAQVTFKSP